MYVYYYTLMHPPPKKKKMYPFFMFFIRLPCKILMNAAYSNKDPSVSGPCIRLMMALIGVDRQWWKKEGGDFNHLPLVKGFEEKNEKRNKKTIYGFMHYAYYA